MERVSKKVPQLDVRSYAMLTKPGIIFGNVITMAGGFFLASKGNFKGWLFLATLIGLSLIIASACIFNNYIDRDADRKMSRTKDRALATGLISIKGAIIFSILLGLLGTLILFFYANPLAAGIALIGLFVYVIPYSFLKYHTVHGTLIGSVAGALPPVVGYTAVSGRLDLAALILFAIVVFWQMPHFFAIALYRMEDYRAASIPVHPVRRGSKSTKVQMLLYVVAFIIGCSFLTLFNYTDNAFLTLSLVLGIIWFVLSLRGFKASNEKRWAREMFAYSLFIIMAICIAIPFTVLP